MKIVYTIDDWIRDRLNSEQARIDAAIAHGEKIVRAMTFTDPDYVAPPPTPAVFSTPTLRADNWFERQWLKAEINFGRNR